MKAIIKEGCYAKPTEFSNVFKSGCNTCGLVDFFQAKKMRIKTGVILWNLVFLMMITYVRGLTTMA
ncbi:hypothetical protein ANANG_G00180500 [Anguilla anguilla]|uniref:Uncharacterized protein n=1 Tax=Anguilla anguilla TaxID=7936 RepID=A0A9D3M6G4_ANGAN|nr:hypothetical protein ANANG_G00180500 [Anguilla anguilla]